MSSVMPRAPSVATEATHPAAWAGAAVAGCRKSAATWPPALDDLDITGMGCRVPGLLLPRVGMALFRSAVRRAPWRGVARKECPAGSSTGHLAVRVGTT